MLLDLALLQDDNRFLDMLYFIHEFLFLIQSFVTILAHNVILPRVHIDQCPRTPRLVRLDQLFDLSLFNRDFEVMELADAVIKLINIELLWLEKVHFLRVSLFL